MGIIVLSAIIAHTAWHPMIDHGQVLWQTRWPQLTLPGLMTLARWIAGVFLCVGAAKLLSNGTQTGLVRQSGREPGRRLS